MKNSQKGFVVPLLIAIIALLAIGSGVYYYSKNKQTAGSGKQSSITNVVATAIGSVDGSPLTITWESSNVEKVNIDLYDNQLGKIVRSIVKNINSPGKYVWEIEDIAAWRDYDGPYKVIVSSATNSSIKAESSLVTLGSPCSPDVCGNPNTVQNTSNYKSGSIQGVYKKTNSWIDVAELTGNKISVKGQASWEGSGASSGQINSGVIDGVVTLNGNKGVYSQNGCEINLAFVQSGLTAKDNNQCGGLNVSFTGEYIRFQDSPSINKTNQNLTPAQIFQEVSVWQGFHNKLSYFRIFGQDKVQFSFGNGTNFAYKTGNKWYLAGKGNRQDIGGCSEYVTVPEQYNPGCIDAVTGKSKYINSNGQSVNYPLSQMVSYIGDIPTLPTTSISNTEIVGVWQNSSVMAAGWSTLYQFFPSGKYNYRVSSMQCSTRDIGHSGYWKIVGDAIQLTEISKTTIVGGNLECGPSGGIMDGTVQTLKLTNDAKIQLNTASCKNAEVSYYSCLAIDGSQFYQFSKDPTYNNVSDLPKEPTF